MTDQTNPTIYLEVSKEHGGIMGATHYPRANSAQFDFVPVTQEEFDHLNDLEDNVLPPGMIVSLSDLIAFREAKAQAAANMAAANMVAVTSSAKIAAAKALLQKAASAPQSAVASVSKPATTKAAPAKKDAPKRKKMGKLEFFKGFSHPAKSEK